MVKHPDKTPHFRINGQGWATLGVLAATVALMTEQGVQALKHKAEDVNDPAHISMRPDAYDKYMADQISHKKFTLKFIPAEKDAAYQTATNAAIHMGVEEGSIHNAALIIDKQLQGEALHAGEPVVLPADMFPAKPDHK